MFKSIRVESLFFSSPHHTFNQVCFVPYFLVFCVSSASTGPAVTDGQWCRHLATVEGEVATLSRCLVVIRIEPPSSQVQSFVFPLSFCPTVPVIRLSSPIQKSIFKFTPRLSSKLFSLSPSLLSHHHHHTPLHKIH